MAKCRFCENESSFAGKEDGDGHSIACPRCGAFEVTGTAWTMIESLSFDGATVSGWIREQNAVGVTPNFDGKNIKGITSLQKPGMKERAERYLLAVSKKYPALGTDYDPYQEHLIGEAYCQGQHELEILVNYLLEQKLVAVRHPRLHRMNPAGHIAADELRARRAKSSQGFIAMWFAADMGAIYDQGFEPAITKAGYKPLRIDKKEDVVKIDDEILSEIRRSAFVVADFTGHRGGVYFEAGFAMGLGIPIVWTCRDDEMAGLHFDIRQYNCLSWTDANELAGKLQRRIEGFLGRGPLVS